MKLQKDFPNVTKYMGMLPCIVFAPQDLYDKYSWKGFNFFAMSNDTWKIYFGDHLTDYEKYGCVIINAEEKSND